MGHGAFHARDRIAKCRSFDSSAVADFAQDDIKEGKSAVKIGNLLKSNCWKLEANS
jgi:hypothetical protein